jgi:choline kinase
MKFLSKLKFKMYNYKNNINIQKLYNISKYETTCNICVLLAAGTSSRFINNKSKQLYLLNDIPIIKYSIDVFINSVDKIIIITNSNCYDEIVDIVNNNPKIFILIVVSNQLKLL